MAKKKEDNVNEELETSLENSSVELSSEEELALEVQSKSNTDDPYSGEFKLENPDTQYGEPGFTLTGDQKKKLPENPSLELLARIRSGFIIKA